MTIDEAIAHEKEVAKQKYKDAMLCHSNPNDEKLDGCIECAREHEQLAEWLEELKALKNGLNIKCDNLNEALEKGKKIGYKKAIDEVIVILNRHKVTFNPEVNSEILKLKKRR